MMNVTVLLTSLLVLAAVIVNGNDGPKLSIHPSGTEYAGPLQVTLGIKKGLVCADSWTDVDAQVACRQMGFTHGEAYKNYASFGTLQEDYITSRYRCIGKERQLRFCSHTVISKKSDCRLGHEAGVLCYNETAELAIRIKGPDSHSGRLDVLVAGSEWRSVCGTFFADQTAAPICRAFNFVDGFAYSFAEEQLPPSQGPLWRFVHQCHGTEKNLNECGGNHLLGEMDTDESDMCLHTAAVVCLNTARVLYGETNEDVATGALGVYYEGEWVLACDSSFTHTEAMVACRDVNPQLPYATVLKGSVYGAAVRPIAVTNVHCDGHESSMSQCQIESTGHCPSGHYVSLMCSKTPDSDKNKDVEYTLEIHWSGSEYSGPVWLRHDGLTKGMICADSWEDRDARVACRQLQNYNNGIAYTHYPTLDTMGIPYFTSEYQCHGNETRLAECGHKELKKDSECQSRHHAGVLCFNDDHVAYRIQGPHAHHGRVEVRVNGQWGTVCGSDWDEKAAGVLCRAHGFQAGGVAAEAPEGLAPAEGPAYDPHFRCSGEEGGLNQCPHLGLVRYVPDKSSCGQDAAVVCKSTVYLLDEQVNKETLTGTVRMQNSGRWGGVCDTGVTDAEASMLCREVDEEVPFGTVLKRTPGHFVAEDFHIRNSIHCPVTVTSLFHCAIHDSRNCTGGPLAIACSNDPQAFHNADINDGEPTSTGSTHLGLIVGLVVGALAVIGVAVMLFLVLKFGFCTSCRLMQLFGHRRFGDDLPVIQQPERGLPHRETTDRI